MECSNCGSVSQVRSGIYPFRESGLRNVVLVGVDVAKCGQCGNEDPIIPNINGLMRVLAKAVISQPNRLSGEQLRFLRKFMGKNGREFCELIGVDKSTLSKWENNEDPVGPSNDRLIRLIVLALDEELKEEIKDVINSFLHIEDKTSEREIDIDPEKMSYQYA